MSTTYATAPATDRQVNYLSTLVNQANPVSERDQEILTSAALALTTGALDKHRASYLIDELIRMPKQPAPVTTTKPAPTGPTATEPGMYRDPVTGRIYKVQISQQNRPYAKPLVEVAGQTTSKGKPKWAFEYEPGAIYQVTPDMRMTVEQAKEFGVLTGTCCVCGIELGTSPSAASQRSAALGIGPVCEKRV